MAFLNLMLFGCILEIILVLKQENARFRDIIYSSEASNMGIDECNSIFYYLFWESEV